ncbi:MAG: hypothetical protein LH473_02290, partial [Chitinophagales bacterium]|nr:hypothetical protein [Chitinophagales bacterium]
MQKNFSIAVLIFILSFYSAILKAQQPVRCVTSEYLQIQEEKFPGTLQQSIDVKNIARQWMQDHPEDLRNSYVIPVVVHVIWKTQAQKISETQVNSQIDVLNEDYNRLNA